MLHYGKLITFLVVATANICRQFAKQKQRQQPQPSPIWLTSCGPFPFGKYTKRERGRQEVGPEMQHGIESLLRPARNWGRGFSGQGTKSTLTVYNDEVSLYNFRTSFLPATILAWLYITHTFTYLTHTHMHASMCYVVHVWNIFVKMTQRPIDLLENSPTLAAPHNVAWQKRCQLQQQQQLRVGPCTICGRVRVSPWAATACTVYVCKWPQKYNK